MSSDGVLGRGHTADVVALDADRVVKRFDPDVSADVAAREAENTRLADEVGLPVPTVHGLTSMDGRLAIVLDRVDGPTMLARLTARPWTVRRAARRLAALQASIHETRVSGTGTGAGVPRVRERIRRNVARAPGLSAEVRDRVRTVLDALPDGDALCHGDFHPGNVLLAARGPVVIDWLDAGRGHPAADVARTSLLLGYAGDGGPVASVFRRTVRWWYLREYRRRTGLTRDRVRAWELPVAAARLTEGVPEEPALRALVESRAGVRER